VLKHKEKRNGHRRDVVPARRRARRVTKQTKRA
jgi:hypothetical protein